MSKRGTWSQALSTFLWPILVVLALRWMVIEPFVIPSGSMIPSLLVHDHVVVKKFSLGIRWPFTDKWLWNWRAPERGEIMVFRFPQNPEIYYIKRLIGLPGDRIEVRSGRIRVNGQEWELAPQNFRGQEMDFDYFIESLASSPLKPHTVRFVRGKLKHETEVFLVPAGEYFFMGDNRDQSNDSRYWGFVKQDLLIGPAWLVWLSCEDTLPTMSFVCDPTQIRWSRIGQLL